MSFASRRNLERRVAVAIEANARLEQERRELAERAARIHDVRADVLSLHQPHAQAAEDGVPPALYCHVCPEVWPCRTVQLVYRFGEYAVPAE